MIPHLKRLAASAIIIATFLILPQAEAAGDSDWRMAEEIVKKIQAPSIPNKEFSITDFGARSDGKTDARQAIMAAIKKAHDEGGGRVVLPAGTWLSNGPIHLQSNIALHVAEGATLLFGTNPADYLPVVHTRWEGTELYGYSPLIYAYKVHDVAITGNGTIDGNADSGFHDWTGNQEADQLKLRHMGNDGTPAEKRIFGKGTYLRPSMIQFFHAKRVLLQDYTLKNSPFWVNHLVHTDHAIVRNIKVDSHRANNDGVDIDSSTYVLVEDSRFRTGDDSVVVKSGRDRDGREIGRPSEYIVVRNNDMGGEDGIALGSEMSGDIRHVFFTDNVLRKGTSAIRFKANLDRGGMVEHIRVRNMTVESFEKHLFWFQLNYPGLLGGGHPSVYRDIVFEDFTVEHAGTVFEAHAPSVAPLRDVTLRNIKIKRADATFILENVDDLKLENVSIGDQTVEGVLDWKSGSD
ncbi:MAG TPA: glycoside hydrolase family 28 protein [Gammaproteobacteria bacterium]|jgi:polygalacturonase